MYTSKSKYVTGITDIAKYLGIGQNKCRQLCQERPSNFPVVKIGKKYQADSELLEQWKNDWYSGKIDIVI